MPYLKQHPYRARSSAWFMLRPPLRFKKHAMIVERKALKSIWSHGGEIRRRIAVVHGVQVVLLSKSHPVLRPSFSRQQWSRFAEQSELPDAMLAEVGQWNRGLRFSFNCHAVAIGGPLGMGPDVWLEGSRGAHTLMSNPAQSLLDRFYTPVASMSKLQELSNVSDDDVVVLRCINTGDLVHSGRVRMLHGEVYLLSKLGEHPTAITRVESVEARYQDDYGQVEVYRLNEDMRPQSTVAAEMELRPEV